MNYTNAKTYCEEKGGQLAEPRTNATFERLRTYLLENFESIGFYIGLNNMDGDGTFLWTSDGSLPQNVAWEPSHWTDGALLLSLLCLTTCVMYCEASTDIIKIDDLFSSVINFLKNGVRVMVNIAMDYLWMLPPWVRSCLPEFKCLFDGSAPYSKCVLYIVKCAVFEVAGVANCFFNLGGDIAIDFYYNGVVFNNYDYSQLGFNVFGCAGYDLEYILNLLKKTFKRH